MWISNVDDVMTNEKKDSAQINSNPLMSGGDFHNLKSPMTARRPIVQRMTLNLAEVNNNNAVVVSLSQRRTGAAAAAYAAAAMSGVDESLFMAD